MFVNVTCPTCGNRFAAPDFQIGRNITCSSCQSPIMIEIGTTASGTVPEKPPAQMDSPSPTILAPLEEPIRYSCPKCKKSLTSPPSAAGQKLNCPGCGQRLQIPQPAAPPQNKTMLAVDESNRGPQAALPAVQAPPPTAASQAPVDVVEVVEVVHPATNPRSANCLECGQNLAGRDTLLTCPDCGSVLCSSRCFREHRRFAHERPKPKRREPATGFQCRYCGTTEPPYYSSQISSEGWVVFALMLVFCLPLFWIGLLITEERRHCYDCGARLS
jgi:DNA-directed RNA polymerase subunit RPC12/RpoP